MRMLDKQQKTQIVKKELLIRKPTDDVPLKLIYRGVKKAVRLIRRVKKRNRIGLEGALARWKLAIRDEFELAADDFRTAILLSKAFQGIVDFQARQRATAEVIGRFKQQAEIRLLFKTWCVLQANVEQRRQKQLQAELAARIRSCKLLTTSINAWKTYIARTARIREVDDRAKDVARLFMQNATLVHTQSSAL